MASDDFERPIREQLSAYNQRDIDAFMRWWAEDCLYYAFPDTLLAKDAAEVRARHVDRFTDETLKATLLDRKVLGNFVIDFEHVRRRFDGAPGEAHVLGIYEVREELIRRAWFVQTQIPVGPTV
jgi:putative hydrolase of HD superfamily